VPTAPQTTFAPYRALITFEYQNSPNFLLVAQASVLPFLSAQGLAYQLTDSSFDLDTALGPQLDAVGVRVGISRYVLTPLAQSFFSWDTAALGWDQGVWLGPYTPTSGVTSLDDDTYRALIRSKIAANGWDGTLGGAMTALSILFPPGGATNVFVQDNQDMTAFFCLSGLIPNALFTELFLGGYVPLKPMAVSVTYLVTSVDTAPMFGWDVSSDYVGGWEDGAWGVDSLSLVIASQSVLDGNFYLDKSILSE